MPMKNTNTRKQNNSSKRKLDELVSEKMKLHLQVF